MRIFRPLVQAKLSSWIFLSSIPLLSLLLSPVLHLLRRLSIPEDKKEKARKAPWVVYIRKNRKITLGFLTPHEKGDQWC